MLIKEFDMVDDIWIGVWMYVGNIIFLVFCGLGWSLSGIFVNFGVFEFMEIKKFLLNFLKWSFVKKWLRLVVLIYEYVNYYIDVICV